MQLKLLFAVLFAVGAAAADWSCIGPFGGPAMSVAASPSNPQILYASPQGYPTPMLKSTDGGSSWKPAGSMGYYAFNISVHPTNPDNVIAAIGSIVRTTNGGTQWNYATVPGGTYARGLARGLSDPQRAYTTGYVYLNSNTRFGVNVSTDGGATWDSVCVDTTIYGNGYAIAVSPTDPNIVYAGGYPGNGATANTVVYKSTDGGSTWAKNLTGINGYWVYAATVSSADPNVVLCGTNTGGIIRSTDAGATWSVATSQYNIQAIAEVPSNLALLYAASDTALLRSSDTGRTWVNTGGIPGKSIRSVGATGASSATVFCATRDGIYRSLTAGGNWQLRTGDVALAKVSAIGIPTADPRTLYAEYKDNAVYKSTDEGATWNRLPDFLSCGSLCGIVIDRNNPQVIWTLEGSG